MIPCALTFKMLISSLIEDFSSSDFFGSQVETENRRSCLVISGSKH